MHLRSVVERLFTWQDDAKNHFKAKVFVFLCDRFLKKKNQCDFIWFVEDGCCFGIQSIHSYFERESNSFQVKLLLGMLITKCGLDAVKAVLPEEHMKLLSNIHKVCWTHFDNSFRLKYAFGPCKYSEFWFLQKTIDLYPCNFQKIIRKSLSWNFSWFGQFKLMRHMLTV